MRHFIKIILPVFICLLVFFSCTKRDPFVNITAESTIPDPPENLQLTVNSSGYLASTWNDRSLNEEGFNIYVAGSSSKPSGVYAKTGLNATSYVISGVSRGMTYYVWVEAYNEKGSSAPIYMAQYVPLEGAPDAPDGLSAEYLGTNKMEISWNDNADNETSYNVYWSLTDSKPVSPSLTLSPNTTICTGTGFVEGETYYIWVEAQNAVDKSAFIYTSHIAVGWMLVWSDEFDGTTLNSAKWTMETGTGVNGDFGTGQLDRATDREENVKLSNGWLVITTRKEFYIDREYTSGRVISQNHGYFRYGKIEARVWPQGVQYKGQGFAFWMMPQYSVYGTWPKSGEVDIMEYVANRSYHNLGSVHFAYADNNNGGWEDGVHGHIGKYYSIETESYYPGDPLSGYTPAPGTPKMSEDFHIYGIEWNETQMTFYIDGNEYHTVVFDSQTDYDGMNPFNEEFYLILSAGVGGSDTYTYGGAIVPEAVFPCPVYIDWVRVYQLQ